MTRGARRRSGRTFRVARVVTNGYESGFSASSVNVAVRRMSVLGIRARTIRITVAAHRSVKRITTQGACVFSSRGEVLQLILDLEVSNATSTIV
jgi:hypothetical protein